MDETTADADAMSEIEALDASVSIANERLTVDAEDLSDEAIEAGGPIGIRVAFREALVEAASDTSQDTNYEIDDPEEFATDIMSRLDAIDVPAPFVTERTRVLFAALGLAGVPARVSTVDHTVSILESVAGDQYLVGKKPSALAGAAAYVGRLLASGDVNQTTIAAASGASAVSIRKHITPLLARHISASGDDPALGDALTNALAEEYSKKIRRTVAEALVESDVDAATLGIEDEISEVEGVSA